jgi:hypothetical protein
MWWIGDWWAFGEKRKHGERAEAVRRWGKEGFAFQTYRNAATVCRALKRPGAGTF